jgi:uncharacterized membrane protein
MSPWPTFYSLTRFAVVAAVVIAAITGAPVLAFQVGDTISGVITVAGKDVPLPGGDHTVVEVGFAKIIQPLIGPQVTPADYGPVRRVVLARIENSIVVDVVEIFANLLAHPDGWGIATECTRDDIYATLTHHKSGWDVSCVWIRPVYIDDINPNQTTERVDAYAAKSEAIAPTFWVETGYRVANRQDLIEVRYRFAALIEGVPAAFADARLWHPAEIGNQPAQLELVQKVAEWASFIYPVIEIGLRRPLEMGATFVGPFMEALNLQSDREGRQAKLAALHDAGVISETEFDRQTGVIQAETEPVLENTWTYATVAGYKAFTYRVVVTTINVGIDYYFIGTPFAAGVLVILQVVINTTKFFFHEVMWQELFGVGPLRRDTPRVMDFVAEVADGIVKTPLPMRPMGEGEYSGPKASPARYIGESPMLIRPRMTW